MVSGTEANGTPKSLPVLDLSNLIKPTQVQTISTTIYGGAANSVAVRNGIVAIVKGADVEKSKQSSHGFHFLAVQTNPDEEHFAALDMEKSHGSLYDR